MYLSRVQCSMVNCTTSMLYYSTEMFCVRASLLAICTCVRHASSFLAGVVAAGAVAIPRAGRQDARQAEFQVRVRIVSQRALRSVSRMPQYAQHRGVAKLEIPVGQRRLLGGAERGVREVGVQVLPVELRKCMYYTRASTYRRA